MDWAQYRPAIMVLASVLVAVGGGVVGTQRERGRGEVVLRAQEKHCDSTVRVVEVQRAAAVARVDSVIRVVETQDMLATVRASASARASSGVRGCRCEPGSHGGAKPQSFLSRWAPPLVGLGLGIAIGHSWAPRAVETVVNVIGDGGGGKPRKGGGHYHGKRWEPGKWCRDARWHGRGKHRGHGKHGDD